MDISISKPPADAVTSEENCRNSQPLLSVPPPILDDGKILVSGTFHTPPRKIFFPLGCLVGGVQEGDVFECYLGNCFGLKVAKSFSKILMQLKFA